MTQARQADLILASASPRRVQLMAQLGCKPDEIVPADIDETAHKSELPSIYAKRMAMEKAALIAARYPQSFVIGGDTVVAVGRRILPKAKSEDDALFCLKLLMGRAHRVYGGLAVACPDGRIIVKHSVSHVQFKRLDKRYIDHYIAQGDWQGKAGGYAIQGAAARFIKQIRGSYSQIMGLDLYLLSNMLTAAGYPYGDR